MALECPSGLIARVAARERATQAVEVSTITAEPVEDGQPELVQQPVVLPPMLDAGWCSGYYDEPHIGYDQWLRKGRVANVGRLFRAR